MIVFCMLSILQVLTMPLVNRLWFEKLLQNQGSEMNSAKLVSSALWLLLCARRVLSLLLNIREKGNPCKSCVILQFEVLTFP